MFAAFWKALWEAGFKWFSAVVYGAGAILVGVYQDWRAGQPDTEVFGMTWPPLLEPWYFWAFFGLMVVVIARLAINEAHRAVCAPTLRFSRPRADIEHVVHRDKAGNESVVASIEYVCVDLHNNPKQKNPASVLRRAHVTLAFYDFHTGEWRGTFQSGRWADNIQPGQPDAKSSLDEYRYRDIHPDDGRNRIDIAQRHKGRMDCYAFTVEGRWQPQYKPDHALELHGTKFYVHLIVKSTNAAPFAGCFVLEVTPEKMTLEHGPYLLDADAALESVSRYEGTAH